MPDKLAFVDIETTGISPVHDRIIEIGVVLLEKAHGLSRWSSLIDPDTYLPPQISSMTGIRSDDLASAPNFRQVADQIMDLLSDSLFIAHNARFDYSFIRQEFGRLGIRFRLPQLCTVKLSRYLFPQYIGHNLDHLIGRFDLKVSHRHRALDDADAVRQFYQYLSENIDPGKLYSAIDHQLRHPSVPKVLKKFNLDGLPEKPGVYIFYGESGMPLYVGKSINLKDRVLSHFTHGLEDEKDLLLYSQTASVETYRTPGELGALLKEAQLIKDLKPLYNRQLRHTEELTFLHEHADDYGYLVIKLETGRSPGPGTLGIFTTPQKAKDFVTARVGEFRLCARLCGLEKNRDRCFQSDLGHCMACTGQEKPLKYNLRFTEAFADSRLPAWPFPGPVLIKEGGSGFIADQWCLKDQPFDPDVYKILKNFVFSPKNRSSITKVPNNKIPDF